MKMPNACPKCKDNMINDFILLKNKYEKLVKCCNKKIDHTINYYSLRDNQDMVDYFIFYNKKKLSISFEPAQNRIIIFDGAVISKIPYFEPNFSNIEEMFNKIKLYETFS